MSSSIDSTTSLIGSIYPSANTAVFPEQANPRYNPAKAILGMCFSGGGARALSCALGQMRGVMASGNLIDSVGAISCVSGGTWFGSLYSYAQSSIDDEALLGSVTSPENISVSTLQHLDQKCIGGTLPHMSNLAVGLTAGWLEYKHKHEGLPYDRFWSRLLNDMIYQFYGLGSLEKYFTLDSATVNSAVANNPSLSSEDFITIRKGRPFFIAGATQIFPDGEGQVLRHFEYSAQYSGTVQKFSKIGPASQDFGYGYCDNFIFNTETPTTTETAKLVSVDAPVLPFLLSDACGSSSAAIGAASEDLLKNSSVFPSFNYWPVTDVGNEQVTSYGFEDGGILENVGIVPLLRRQYRIIIACVASPYPVGSADGNCVDGVDGQISRLFGLNPKPEIPPPGFSTQDTQVFDNDNQEFDDLVKALKLAKSKGSATMATGIYKIKADNTFCISSYPDGQKVGVIWVYNDLNEEWHRKLSSDVKTLLCSDDRTNYMKNFPHYSTVGQNASKVLGVWVPELLYYTPQQINLLADMHCYSMMENLTEQLQTLSAKLGMSGSLTVS